MAFDLSHGREIYDRWGRHPVEVYAWNGGSLFTAVATKTPDGSRGTQRHEGGASTRG